MYVIKTNEVKPDIIGMKQKVTEMMKRGVKIADLSAAIDYYKKEASTIEAKLKDDYDIDNPRSPKQVTDYLKRLTNEVGPEQKNEVLEACYDPETNKWTSKEAALLKLDFTGFPFARDMLDYRKMKSTYTSLESLKNAMDSNNLIHPTISLQKTNRISYSEPALMSIPKAMLWDVVKPLKQGDSLISVDIKNQEPSILINILCDEKWKDCLRSDLGLYEELFMLAFKPTTELNIIGSLLNEPRLYEPLELDNLPISVDKYSSIDFKDRCYSLTYNGEKVLRVNRYCHGNINGDSTLINYPSTVAIQTESGVYEVPVKWEKPSTNKKLRKDTCIKGELQGLEFNIPRDARNQFKTAWLAMSYGSSMKSIKENCTLIDGKRVYQFFSSFEPIKDYKSQIKKAVKAGKSSAVTIFGTPVFSNKVLPGDIERSLMDIPIQGTAADILSILINHFNEEVEKKGLSNELFIYYTRHDELIIEASQDLMSTENKENTLNFIKDTLEHRIITPNSEWVPFKIEIKVVGVSSEEQLTELDNIDEFDEE